MIEITGRRESDTHPDHAGEEHLVLYRTFRADIDTVWRALTEPERMARWIGEWEGEPATGRVGFRMTAEGDDVSTEPHIIEACDPPHRLRVRSDPPDPDQAWTLELRLSQTGDTTTLRFAQVITPHVPVDMVGPGWEYYLARFAAVLADAPVEAVAWSDYEALMPQYMAGVERNGAAAGPRHE